MRLRLDQELFAGLIPLHILHHAGEKPIYGLWIIEELARHGYQLSAGTLYPLLHRLERRGLLRSVKEPAGQSTRRVYAITPSGRRTLVDAKEKVKELFRELFESELRRVFGHGQSRHGQRVREPRGQHSRVNTAGKRRS